MNKNFRHGNSAALMNQEISQNPASRMGYQSKPKRRAMSEAPKKIWIRELPRKEDGVLIGLSYHTEPEGLVGETEIPYIRSDIVDELVKALKEAVDLSGDPVEWFEWRDSAVAALAKLEKSHE